MTVNRLTDNSGSPGTLAGNTYLDQVAEEIKALWDTGTVITLTAVAGTNTITATLAPVMSAGLQNGMNFILKPAATNTGAVTLNINSGGAVSIVDAEGTALTAGALRINNHYLLNYDSGIAKFVVIGYTPAAIVPYGLKLLQHQDASASSSIDFVNGVGGCVLDNTYDRYQLEISGLVAATDQVTFQLQVGTGGGPTYQTTLYENNDMYMFGSTQVGQAGSAAGQINLSWSSADGNALGNAAGENLSSTILFNNPEASLFQFFRFHTVNSRATDGRQQEFRGCGAWQSATAITALRLKLSVGNITSGGFGLYGYAKS